MTNNSFIKLVFLLNFILLMINCKESDHFTLYSISSPKGDKCLYFMGKYGKWGDLKNNRFYLLGFNPNSIDNLPDSNYIEFEFYDADLSFVMVRWDLNKIIIRDCKIINNKLSKNCNLDVKNLRSEDEDKEIKANFNKLWFEYQFKGIHGGQYKSCK